MATTTYNGRTLSVELVENDKNVNSRKGSSYKLTGTRGAEYYLIRNANTPSMLYPVKFKGRMALPGGWFKEVAPMQLVQVS